MANNYEQNIPYANTSSIMGGSSQPCQGTEGHRCASGGRIIGIWRMEGRCHFMYMAHTYRITGSFRGNFVDQIFIIRIEQIGHITDFICLQFGEEFLICIYGERSAKI